MGVKNPKIANLASSTKSELDHIAEGLRHLATETGALSYDPANARKHNAKNLNAIKSSLARFGQRTPIVVQAQGLIVRAGNGRLEAARSLGWSHIAALVVDESSVDATAYAIADNRTGELASWDEDILAATLKSLGEDGWDVAEVGFDDKDLAALPAWGDYPEPHGTTEDTPPENAPARTKRGDVWQLGDHRLMCGDSTSAEDVATLLDGAEPFLMVTDPPYGVRYVADWRSEIPGRGNERGKRGSVVQDHRVDWLAAWRCFSGPVAYVWHGGTQVRQVLTELEQFGFELRSQIIWNKPNFALSRGHYHWKHEACVYMVRVGETARWSGDRKQSTVWDIGTPSGDDKLFHGTQKAVECMARPIRNHGEPGDAVYEPFSGSGTTIIACEQLQRRCFAMEIHPPYADMAVERWERFTGQTAVKVSEAP